jgi:hypothetical protein
MDRIRRSPEIRRVIIGLVLALGMAAGAGAYEAVQYDDCAATCGPCYVLVTGCDSCESGSSGDECFAQGIGCDTVECECGAGWGCTYYEY